ncbi:MAG: sulfotransferase family protein [Acidobacteriota bacterium]
MPIDVLGVGFGRTGTLSLKTALDQLGLPCYHMSEVLPRRSHRLFWLRVASEPPETEHDWEKVLADYRATVDNPGAAVWRQLLEAYPEAKVILTLHPKGAESWFDSTLDTIYRPQLMWESRILEPLLPPVRHLNQMARGLIWDRFHGGTMPDRERSIARYQEHIEEVSAAVPPERLLSFRATDGWEPLCEFLGLEVPEQPFPRVNERREMRRRMLGMAVLGRLIVLAAIAALAALLWSLT